MEAPEVKEYQDNEEQPQPESNPSTFFESTLCKDIEEKLLLEGENEEEDPKQVIKRFKEEKQEKL